MFSPSAAGFPFPTATSLLEEDLETEENLVVHATMSRTLRT